MFFQRKRKILRKTLWHSRITTPVSSSSSTMAPTIIGHLQSPAPYCYQSGADASVGSTNCCGVDVRNQRNVHRKSVNSRRGDVTANSLANCCLNTACSSSSSSSDNDLTEQHQYRLYCALFDRLKSSQLSTLSDAVKHASSVQQQQQLGQAPQPPLVQHQQLALSAGVTSNSVPYAQQPIPSTTSSDCILVQRDQIMGEEPHVIACRIWRWPDLNNADELKRIPSCPSGKDPVYVCCNPNHWSRTCKTESPPPPYYPYSMERLKQEDISMSGKEQLGGGGAGGKFQGSLTTDGEDLSSSTGWCQLAYWELTERVGRLFPVENSSVNVFSDQPRGDGLCLTTLAQQKHTLTPDAVLKARQKIGLGVTLSHESDGVWLYNRSKSPVFVHSPTLSDLDTKSMLVYRVPPGHCVKAFDPVRAATEKFVWPSYIAGAQIGPVDIHSVRISFAKGWGPRYSRQEVTACPCWLEVLLRPCR